MTEKYPFLSDAWFAAADALIREHAPPAPPTDLVMNLEVAADGDPIRFHMGARSGSAIFGQGHADGADLLLATDMDTARQVFVDGNPQAGMNAFMSGKVKVQGDMSKLMMHAAGGAPGGAPALAEALQAITE